MTTGKEYRDEIHDRDPKTWKAVLDMVDNGAPVFSIGASLNISDGEVIDILTASAYDRARKIK